MLGALLAISLSIAAFSVLTQSGAQTSQQEGHDVLREGESLG